MSSCDFFEVEISALIDGELSTAEALRSIDHIVTCPACRDFYCSARAVEAALDEAALGARAESLPQGMWARIEDAAGAAGAGAEGSRAPRRLVPTWALRVAAVAVLAVGAAVLAAVLLSRPVSPPTDMVIQLEGNPGAMTDGRFLELATEILQADRRYHLKMEQIMTAVNRHTFTLEGPSEGTVPIEDLGGEVRRASAEGDAAPGASAQVWY